ncbi:hypothetical protein OZX62_09225 [Bifidobacterium sp. ESL0690]|uniref:hypothetical protein n=1 Tax=Bifidobacterium sp. ESL0690 TaxID=2983214 RepID=UPI0023F794F5|nr:hypothetical protein [Bifidobacterium sp. ESL0690]WEV46595.1 hypothetical protein OZX62_09225 [Bifidobacterium sp. ESL0690]
MPNNQKGPIRSNYLQEFIATILAVFVVKADNVIVDIVLVAVAGYLVMMDFRDRRNL